jgi:hypothetical protein
MSSWGLGTPWGLAGPWGSGGDGEEFACNFAQDRVLVQHPDITGERKFRDWICKFAEGAGKYLDVATDVKNGFDLDTAIGYQLNAIGRVVNLPRYGFNDTDYRRFIRIQINLLISSRPSNPNWVGTHNNLLRICRAFITPSVLSPVVLTSSTPYNYTLSVPNVSTLEELKLLTYFVCQATWAGVLGQIIYTGITSNNTVWDSVHGVVPDGGIWCSVHGVVPNCGEWSHTVTIGDKPCGS